MELHVFVILLSVYLASSRPQNSYNWGDQQSRYLRTNYNSYRRYYEEPPVPISPSNDHANYGFHRPYIQAPRMALTQRSRGPARDTSEYNTRRVAVSSATERNDAVPLVRKNNTRILNSPGQGSKPGSSPDIMQNEQSYDFVFPDAKPILTTAPPITRRSFLPDPTKIKSSCKGKTICTFAENYPKEHIKTVLKKSADDYNDLFGNDVIPAKEDNVTISTRIDVSMDANAMCPSMEQVVQPQIAESQDSTWKYIVNEGNHVQGIRVEICEKESAPCRMSSNFPAIYVTQCKQKYIFRKMLALDENGQPVPDSFRVPSCCTCYFKFAPTADFRRK